MHERVSGICFKDPQLSFKNYALTEPLRPFVTARSPGLSQCKYPMPGIAQQQQETTMAKTSQRHVESRAKAGALRKPKPARDMTPAATKSERITMLLQRAKGASIDEIVGATGWQHHSIRGFISGTIVRRKGFTIVSDKTDGERRYRIVEAEAAS